MRLTRDALNLYRACSDDETRPALANIHVRPDGLAEASDGYLIVRLASATLPAGDYPQVAGMTPTEPGDYLVPAKAAKAALPIMKKARHLPTLNESAAIQVNGRPHLVATDLDTTATTPLPQDMTYPNVEQVMAGVVTREAARHVVALGIPVLEKLLATLKPLAAHVTPVVRLILPANANSAIRVELIGRDDVTAVLMPCPDVKD